MAQDEKWFIKTPVGKGLIFWDILRRTDVGIYELYLTNVTTSTIDEVMEALEAHEQSRKKDTKRV